MLKTLQVKSTARCITFAPWRCSHPTSASGGIAGHRFRNLGANCKLQALTITSTDQPPRLPHCSQPPFDRRVGVRARHFVGLTIAGDGTQDRFVQIVCAVQQQNRCMHWRIYLAVEFTMRGTRNCGSSKGRGITGPAERHGVAFRRSCFPRMLVSCKRPLTTEDLGGSKKYSCMSGASRALLQTEPL